jgi:histidinol dehydrogenase
MNICRFSDRDYEQRIRQLTEVSPLFDATIEQRSRAILDDVKARGDAALLELTERFDGARLRGRRLGPDSRPIATLAGRERAGELRLTLLPRDR